MLRYPRAGNAQEPHRLRLDEGWLRIAGCESAVLASAAGRQPPLDGEHDQPGAWRANTFNPGNFSMEIPGQFPAAINRTAPQPRVLAGLLIRDSCRVDVFPQGVVSR